MMRKKEIDCNLCDVLSLLQTKEFTSREQTPVAQ